MSAARRTSTAIRFKPDVAAELRDLSDQYDVSVNWLVNRAVQHWLEMRQTHSPVTHIDTA